MAQEQTAAPEDSGPLHSCPGALLDFPALAPEGGNLRDSSWPEAGSQARRGQPKALRHGGQLRYQMVYWQVMLFSFTLSLTQDVLPHIQPQCPKVLRLTS